MAAIAALRSGKPAFYPDQALYAEFSAGHFGLDFEVHDDGAGSVFSVFSRERRFYFGAGRCPVYPQNNATSAYLATDKHFANIVLGDRSIPNTGGNYFFLNDRSRNLRSPGHDIGDARLYFRKLGCRAFVKPLAGSRGDFAQVILSDTGFEQYLGAVAAHHDSIIIQNIYRGREYRLFVLDGKVLYSARKRRPFIVGDGTQTIRELIASHSSDLEASGISLATDAVSLTADLDRIPDLGERIDLPGRHNRSAGGAMRLEKPHRYDAAADIALSATLALGLCVAGVDIFEDDAETENAGLRIVEVNSSPAIRLLEDIGREDLILEIWHSTFLATGLLRE